MVDGSSIRPGVGIPVLAATLALFYATIVGRSIAPFFSVNIERDGCDRRNYCYQVSFHFISSLVLLCVGLFWGFSLFYQTYKKQ